MSDDQENGAGDVRGNPPAAGGLSRRAQIIAVALVLLHAILGWISRSPGVAWGEDDVAYITLAQQLRHFSYREVQDIAAPVHARFPPGFPAAIALWGAPFSDRYDALLALVAIFSAVTLILAFDATRRIAGERLALFFLAVIAVNPSMLSDSGHIMAETQFNMFTMLALWATVRERENVKFTILAGVAAGIAALTRTAGLVLIVALVAYWLWERRFVAVGVFAMLMAATVGTWIVWTFLAPDAEHRRLYVADLGLRATQQHSVIIDILQRLPDRTQRLLTRLLPNVVALPTIAGTIVDNAVALAASLVLATVGFVVLARRWLAAASFLFCYMGLLFLWRYALARFTSPIIPLLLLALLLGAWFLAGRINLRWQLPAVAALSALLLIGAGEQDAPLVRRGLSCDRSNPIADGDCWKPEERAYMMAARWARDSTPPDAVFFVSKERAFYYHSGRRTINQDRALEEDSLSLAPYLRARGALYTVTTAVGISALQHGKLIAHACRDFVLVRDFRNGVALLRVRGVSEPVDPNACHVVNWWRDRADDDR